MPLTIVMLNNVRGHTTMFTFPVIYQYLDGAGSCHSYLGRRRTSLYHTVSTMLADGLEMQGAKRTAAMVLT